MKMIFQMSTCLFLLTLLIDTGCTTNQSRTAEVQNLTTDTTVGVNLLSDAKGEWIYDSSVDKMDTDSSFYAEVTSSNTVHFKAPYDGGSTFVLGLQKKGKSATDIYMKVSSGQFLTNVTEQKNARIKFDDEAPMNIGVVGTTDYKSDVVFLRPIGTIISKLKKAKKVIIECEFFQDGSQQAEFNVQHLKWNRK